MKVLIYAAGSVGLGIASCLLNSDVQTDLITRQETDLFVGNAHAAQRQARDIQVIYEQFPGSDGIKKRRPNTISDRRFVKRNQFQELDEPTPSK